MIAKEGFCVTYEQLASHCKISTRTAERYVNTLVEHGHLRKVSGRAGRVPNGYEPVIFNHDRIDVVNHDKFDGVNHDRIDVPLSPSSSQESPKESSLSNSVVKGKKGKSSKVADRGSFNSFPSPVQETTKARTPTKAKQDGIVFDDDDEVSKLLNEFAIDEETYRKLKKLKGSEALAILKLASKKTNPKGYILVSIKNAQQEADAAGDKLGTLLDKDARDVILRRELSDIQAAQLRHLISEIGDRLRRGFENACRLAEEYRASKDKLEREIEIENGFYGPDF
jgi:predicted CopG family antitoxin